MAEFIQANVDENHTSRQAKPATRTHKAIVVVLLQLKGNMKTPLGVEIILVGGGVGKGLARHGGQHRNVAPATRWQKVLDGYAATW